MNPHEGRYVVPFEALRMSAPHDLIDRGIDQGAEHDGFLPVDLCLSINALDRFLGFLDRVDERQSHLTQAQAAKLTQ